MNYLILGSAGFIGKNLVKELSVNKENNLVLFDRVSSGFNEIKNCKEIIGEFSNKYDFESLLDDIDIVIHLISTSSPNSNESLVQGIEENVVPTLKLLDACVTKKIKKFVFISSGGTVYGDSYGKPFKENDYCNPICSYGIQKLTIEKYLHLYYHKYNLDYSIIRLSNPYGPGQNPNGQVGAICVFLSKVIRNEKITIFGDGSNVRDYIYIDDAVKGIINISNCMSNNKVYNLGSGEGTSLNNILEYIKTICDNDVNIVYLPQRINDLDYSVLNIERYQEQFLNHNFMSIKVGIGIMYDYLCSYYKKKESD